MLKFFLLIAVVLFAPGIAPQASYAGEEPQIPVEASWGMTIEQAQRLVGLDRNAKGILRSSYIIRGATRHEFVALWQNRPISFYIAKDIGLYAINIEMRPQSIRHTQTATDQELMDIEQYAPIRFAILQKYGAPSGVAQTWDAEEVSPLTQEEAFTDELKKTTIQWTYARNWLIWEGAETRLALGEQSIWYASQIGLIKKQQRKRDLVREQEQSIDNELERQLDRQRQVEAAKSKVPSRASAFTSFF